MIAFPPVFQAKKYRTPHPFPARMAASIPLSILRKNRKRLRVLDPMSGSGTSVAVARAASHFPIAFDTDPLAVLLTTIQCSDVKATRIIRCAERVLNSAKRIAQRGTDSFPEHADKETKAFIRYWFDLRSRGQLAALSRAIAAVRDASARRFLWCAMSRLIITKDSGVSLARDVSHSRPHRCFKTAPIMPFGEFTKAVQRVVEACPFKYPVHLPRAQVRRCDARHLPLQDESIDLVITSPPYLNAIDYMRGHKLSLVWMGYKISSLRKIRSSNVGTESSCTLIAEKVNRIMKRMGSVNGLPERYKGMIARYIMDLELIIREITRVLVRGGKALIIVGDSTLRSVYIRNSVAIRLIAEANGLSVYRTRRRRIPRDRRYLPPPGPDSGKQLAKRMRTEVLLSLRKR